MKKPLVAADSPRPKIAAYRSATARAPDRSPTRRRRASSPSRQPERATRPSVCSARSAWLKRGTPFVPAMFAREMSRHRLRHPTADRASSTRCGPRPRSPIPRRSSLTGSRWPGNRIRSGRGRVGTPSTMGSARGVVGVSGRRVRLRRRRGATTMPPGSATAASSSSISSPMTGCRPTASAAPTNRTAPYSPAWSVTASPVSPSSTARSTRSSAGEAPSRNEKLVWQWSSAYGVGATGRSGRGPAAWGPVSIEHLF